VLLAAVILQTSLFARIRPFDVAPALTVLVVVGFARHFPADLVPDSFRTCSP
jgi:hypothetical protein